jgi:phosphoesterase RecJ-like protein
MNDSRPQVGFPLEALSKARHRVNEASNIVILSHIRPDGDAVGSVLGLGLSLQQAGKTVQMILLDGLPGSFRHLPGADRVRTSVEMPYDMAIIVDCSDLERIGEALQPGTVPDLNIDHHATNLNFAQINLVDDKAVSTTAILTELLPHFGLDITAPVASALLTGLITDSLGFRTPGMSSNALRLAADLTDAGADLPALYYMALTRRSFESARLWGTGLANLTREDGLVWTSVSLAERKAIHYPGLDDADLVNMLPTIDGVKIAVIFLEQPDGRVKISWRSKQGYDISDLALQYGGGGHKNAAGASLDGPFNSVKERVLASTRNVLNTPIPAS